MASVVLLVGAISRKELARGQPTSRAAEPALQDSCDPAPRPTRTGRAGQQDKRNAPSRYSPRIDPQAPRQTPVLHAGASVGRESIHSPDVALTVCGSLPISEPVAVPGASGKSSPRLRSARRARQSRSCVKPKAPAGHAERVLGRVPSGGRAIKGHADPSGIQLGPPYTEAGEDGAGRVCEAAAPPVIRDATFFTSGRSPVQPAAWGFGSGLGFGLSETRREFEAHAFHPRSDIATLV